MMRSACLLLLVISHHAIAHAQLFGPQIDISLSTAGATFTQAADLDGDGDLDVLTASTADDKIAWYANDGSGTFGLQQIISTLADGAECVASADLDGDGDVDVLSASYLDDKIAWYANDGSGAFGPQQIITTLADAAQSVASADLDGDGDLDVLSASVWDNKIAWYDNDGSGAFGPEQIISTLASAVKCVASADLDGDGDLDVLTAAYGTIAWYVNDGSGGFSPQQVISTSVAGAHCVTSADLDDDGDLDVLSASSVDYDNEIAWYRNDGSGTFGPEQIISTTAYNTSSVASADLDGDGDLDVLSTSFLDLSPGNISWYANNGWGSFGPEQIISDITNGANCFSSADLDGDGDMDVISASFDNKVSWYTNDGSGAFGPENLISTSINGPNCVVPTDLDSDGDLDVLFSAHSHIDLIAWYANDGSGAFGPPRAIATEGSVVCVASADLDGDADLDVIYGGFYGGNIGWYANDGFGIFGPQQFITHVAYSPSWVASADLDGDGDLDVLSASQGNGGMIAWYSNDGSGAFGPQQIISTLVDGAMFVASADLDGDGDLDALSASRNDDKIAWYANDGSGVFGPQEVISTLADGAQFVGSADLDGDGDLDVLSASNNDDKIAWYVNDGSGAFGPEEIISIVANGAWSVASADLDGNGSLDVLSASYSYVSGEFDNRIAWYANDGTGTLGAQEIISTLAEGARYVAPADLDGDGDTDVLSASLVDDKIAWYENLTLTTAVPTVAAEQVALYPNPMSTSATVLLDQMGGTVLLEIFDMQGRSVRSEELAVQERRIIVPRNGLMPGLYQLRITGEKRSEAKLFVE